MRKPLLFVDGVGKPQTYLLLVNRVSGRLGTVDLGADIVLLISPPDDPRDLKLSQQLLFLEIFHQKLVILLAKDGLSRTVGERCPGEISENGFFCGEHIHPAVGVFLPVREVLLVAFGAGSRTDIIFAPDIAVGAVTWNRLSHR